MSTHYNTLSILFNIDDEDERVNREKFIHHKGSQITI